ncbi:glycosyltransferase [Siculibacillus lacustris]|uniref:Glycosyltransferase n=1 Tax=Siculibacillus lacustris TaxID=1549641 RepID=A0A4Q9VUD6_9HYPH|nr:glycosyltransferase [Siculibacillus lacustris]TBW39765.1 glycosyltransferase [Siculibacillus lacustris]
MGKRRLLFYTPSLSGGGAERVWAVIASALARRGHDVTFAVDFQSDDNAEYLDRAVPRVVLARSHRRSLSELTRLVRRERFDVIFPAVGACDLKALAAAALAGRHTAVVLSYHGYYENETGRLSRAKFRLTALLTRLAARAVCVSDGLRRDVVERWGGDPKRCVRIYNPIHAEAPRPIPTMADLAARPDTILAVGRLIPIKGFDRLLRAFARLDRPQARLVILGQGEEHDRLLALAAELGVADRFELPGYVTRPWTWYAAAKCLALSSRFEAFGNVVVEALAAGLPVVATACDGPREILADPRHGTLVPIDDVAAMAAALEATLAAPGDPLPRIARAHDFSVAVAADAYETLIDEVVAAHPVTARA